MAQEAPSGGVSDGAAVNEVLFTAVKPRLFVEAPKAKEAVQFYKTAFGAEEVNRVMHAKRKAEQEVPLLLAAELKLGSYSIIVSDIIADDSVSPWKTVGSQTVFSMETEDVEAALEKAVAAGASSEGVTECDFGGCVGKLKDPYGNVWLICSPAKVSADVEAA